MHHRTSGQSRRRTILSSVAATAALTLGLAACGGSDSSDSSGSGSDATGAAVADAIQLKAGELNFDPTKYCGDKPMKVGYITGFGSNTWSVTAKAVIDKFKDYCPNITELEYYDANGDVTKYNNTLNAWAAQGFNVVYAFDGTFGTQTLPAFRAAQQAGVKIGVANIPLGDDVVPDTVTASVVQDQDDMAAQYVKFFDDAKKDGTSQILLIGGTPGNTLDPGLIKRMKANIEETGADVKFLQDSPIVGNWDIAASAQAAAAVIPKYKNIDGVLLTNAAVAPAVMRAFQSAGRPVPAIGGTGITSGTICEVEKVRKSDPNVQMLSLDATGNSGPIALAKAMAAFQGIDESELGPDDVETYVRLAPYVDTLNGQMPECDSSLPADADPTMALTTDEIAAAVG